MDEIYNVEKQIQKVTNAGREGETEKDNEDSWTNEAVAESVPYPSNWLRKAYQSQPGPVMTNTLSSPIVNNKDLFYNSQTGGWHLPPQPLRPWASSRNFQADKTEHGGSVLDFFLLGTVLLQTDFTAMFRSQLLSSFHLDDYQRSTMAALILAWRPTGIFIYAEEK
jgi:hypothetical protein